MATKRRGEEERKGTRGAEGTSNATNCSEKGADDLAMDAKIRQTGRQKVARGPGGSSVKAECLHRLFYAPQSE